MAEAHHTLIVASAEALAASAPIEDARYRGSRLAEADGVTVVALSFDAGAVLSQHIAPGPILIQTVTGEVVVEVEGSKITLPLGGILHIDARVPHEVRAVTKARILVTILQGTQAGAEQPTVPGIIRKAIPVEEVSASAAPAAAHDHDCTCGEEDEPLPELDVRTIPHAIRHATVFGALDGMTPGKAFVLVAHHDPLPLLAQIERRYSGAIATTYDERGPEVWRIQLTRTA